MVKAILNKRGASVSSVISFEEDVEEEILIGYYAMDHDVGIYKAPDWRSLYVDENYTDGTSSRKANTGYTDTPYVYCWTTSTRKIFPKIQYVKIKINKGSYAVSNLADLISQQLSNGLFNEPFDYKVNNVLKANLLEYGMPFNGGMMDRHVHAGVLDDDGSRDDDEQFFIGTDYVRTAWDLYVKDEDTLATLGDTAATIRAKPPAAGSHLSHFFNGRGMVTYPWLWSYIGASPYFEWNSSENRFFLQSLHMPFQVPTIDVGATKGNADAGQDATEFKNQVNTFKPEVSCNPRCAFGGIYILNPAFKTCQTNSDVDYTKTGYDSNKPTAVKDAIDNLNNEDGVELDRSMGCWVGYMDCDFDECFSTTALADDAWKKTFWARLGFEKSQFGVKNRFSYKYQHTDTTDTLARGITTTQDYSIAMAQASSGLGEAPAILHDIVVQTFCGDRNTSLGAPSTEITSNWRVLTNTKPLVAQRLPQLSSEIPYYNVYTDLVPANWFSNQGARMNLVGNVSLNYQSADMIYSFADGIDFEITESRVVSSVRTRITQPNGNIPSEDFFDPYSCVIYKVTRPTKQFDSQNISLDAKGDIVEATLSKEPLEINEVETLDE